MAEAVREALAEEMRRDPTRLHYGRGCGRGGHAVQGPVRTGRGIRRERVIDTPISEAGFTGIGVGAAMTGMRPVVDIMFGDFLTLTMDQMVNQAAKVHYMSGGTWKVPMVLRTTLERHAPLGRAALAIAPGLAEPRSGTESRAAVHSVRRQGAAEDRHPRR